MIWSAKSRWNLGCAIAQTNTPVAVSHAAGGRPAWCTFAVPQSRSRAGQCSCRARTERAGAGHWRIAQCGWTNVVSSPRKCARRGVRRSTEEPPEWAPRTGGAYGTMLGRRCSMSSLHPSAMAEMARSAACRCVQVGCSSMPARTASAAGMRVGPPGGHKATSEAHTPDRQLGAGPGRGPGVVWAWYGRGTGVVWAGVKRPGVSICSTHRAHPAPPLPWPTGVPLQPLSAPFRFSSFVRMARAKRSRPCSATSELASWSS